MPPIFNRQPGKLATWWRQSWLNAVLTQQTEETLGLGPHYSVDEWTEMLAASAAAWSEHLPLAP
jgi:hypothetical protein